MGDLILIAIGAALVNNIILSQFLGLCSFLGVSKKVNTALGMGYAVIFVVTLSAIITWLVNEFVLKPFNMTYLQTIVFILIIAFLVQLVEMVLKKYVPPLYKALGIFLPLITTNCAVLGVAITNLQKNYNFFESFISALFASIGFTVAILILAGIREKIDLNKNVPESFRGMPLTLVTSGLMAIAFFGFSGLI